MSKLHLNPAFNPSKFLRNSWQQAPVLLPQLIPDFEDLIEPSELAGLACEDMIESRLITESKPGRWNLQHGPFEEAVFTSLPDNHWTILVQAVDQWIDAVAKLRTLFEFIPRWRIEDVMVSYAVDKGGVGPHFDYYDVILLQGSGQRLWQIGKKVADDAAMENQDGVGILRSFICEQEFVLNPGDALYVPPQYAHWGRSLGASTCYSIGFRAPALSEMLEGFSDTLIANCQPSRRYTDNEPAISTHPACISPASIDAAFQLLHAELDSPRQFARWFGCRVTQPKYPELRDAPSRSLTEKNLQARFGAGGRFAHHPSSRFAFLPADASTGPSLFVDGDAFELPGSCSELVSQLCDATALKQLDFSDIKQQPALLKAVLQLLNQGSLLLH